MLDIGCLEYTYGILAASALYHFSSSELMQKVSGIGIYKLKSSVLANVMLSFRQISMCPVLQVMNSVR